MNNKIIKTVPVDKFRKRYNMYIFFIKKSIKPLEQCYIFTYVLALSQMFEECSNPATF